MEFQETKVADVPIAPVQKRRGGSKSAKPFKGEEIIDIKYPNVFFLAKKMSGKTTSLLTFLRARANKRHTNIIVISATVKHDDAWINGIANLRRDGYRVIAFDSIVNKDYDQPINLIDELLREFKTLEKEKPKPKRKGSSTNEVTKQVLNNSNQNFANPEKQMQNRLIQAMMGIKTENQVAPIAAPVNNIGVGHVYNNTDEEFDDENIFQDEGYEHSDDFILVLDDLPSSELRLKAVSKLLKVNRHFKCQVVISSQYVTDLDPSSRRQIELWLLFKALSDKNLEEVLNSSGLPIEFDRFKKIYEFATREMYNFLYVDTRGNGSFRRNFDIKIDTRASMQNSALESEIADEQQTKSTSESLEELQQQY